MRRRAPSAPPDRAVFPQIAIAGAGVEALGAEIVRGDVLDATVVDRAVEGCSLVFHLAAARGRHKLSRRGFREQNRRGAVLVAQAAIRSGAQRVVFTSTAALLGPADGRVRDESVAGWANSHYRASKVIAEEALRHTAARGGISVVVAYLPSILGPGARDWRRYFLALNRRQVRYLPRGGVAHPGDVADMVEGIRLCGITPGIDGEGFLLAAAAPIAVPELYRTMAAELGVRFAPRDIPAAPFRAYARAADLVYQLARVQLPYGYTCEWLVGQRRYDISKARRVLGYHPRYDAAASVRRTADWLREQELLNRQGDG